MKLPVFKNLSVCMVSMGLWAVLLANRIVSGQNQATCDGLDDLVQQTVLLDCTRNAACDRVVCESANPLLGSYTLTMTLLSCRNPPGMRAVVNQSAEVVYDDVIDSTMNGVAVDGGNTLSITLDHLQNPPSIAVQIDVVIITFGAIPIIPNSRIPLDTQSCTLTTTVSVVTTYVSPSSVIPSSSSTGGHTLTLTSSTDDASTTSSLTTVDITGTQPGFKSTQTPSTAIESTSIKEGSLSSSIVNTRLPITQGPTPTSTPIKTPVANTTCSVLKDTAANAEIFECTSDTTEPCDRIYCSEEIRGENYDAIIVLLVCEDPAAVRLELSSSDGTVGVNETVDQSEEIKVPGLFGFSMEITIDHFPDALGIQVDGKVFTEVYTIIKYTVVPLERSKTCNGNGDSEKTSDSSSKAVATQSTLVSLVTILTVVTASFLVPC